MKISSLYIAVKRIIHELTAYIKCCKLIVLIKVK